MRNAVDSLCTDLCVRERFAHFQWNGYKKVGETEKEKDRMEDTDGQTHTDDMTRRRGVHHFNGGQLQNVADDEDQERERERLSSLFVGYRRKRERVRDG